MAKGSGIKKEFESSDALYEVTGIEVGTKSEFNKAIWAYAEENGLKESRKHKGRNTGGFVTDDNLKDIFGKKSWVALTEVMSGIGKHTFELED